jgi:protein involved in polysaccharide export with SLBB domain
MNFIRVERQIAVRNAISAYNLRFLKPGMVLKLAGLVLLCLPAAQLVAQTGNPDQQSDSSDSTQSPSSTSTDCSDPVMANTSQCQGSSSQGQGQSNSGLSTQGRSGNSIQPANGNYNDIEQLSRQGNTRGSAQQLLLPPEPLTEFQNFVISTSGKNLPIYGSDLFRRVPSTYAPLDMTPVPPEYVIGPGDELRIRVWGQVHFTANVRVDRSGEIFLPQVGSVHIAGVASSALDRRLREAIGRVYQNFDLIVDVGQIRSIQVYLSGQARRPGLYTVSSLSSLVDTLFVSGGPSVSGSMRRIQVRRDGKTVTEFDLYSLLIDGDRTKDVKLESGDVIYIPPVGGQAAVLGSVKMPAIYELLPGETLKGLLASAGNVSTTASNARVSIERIEEHKDREAMEVADDEAGLATPVADGDLVRVYSIIPRYQKTVTLRGNTSNPGRFAWHPGMHVSELIPDKDSLITRNYWWRRARLGLPAPEELDRPTPPVVQWNQATPPYSLQSPLDNQIRNLNQNPYSNQNQGQGSGQNNSLTQNPYSTEDPYLNPNLSQDEMADQDPNLNPYPSPYQMQDQSQAQGSNQSQNNYQNQYQGAQQRSGGSSLGAAENAVTNSKYPGPLQRTVIRELAPEIDWDYAVIERLDSETLKPKLLPFDLGKLVLQHDSAQDLELQPGDVVSIFSQADFRVPISHQTKQVTLNGEFVHAGVYTAEEGETLRHLVDRAGGLTKDAYLYGSEFTRQTTRAVQQARIDEYIQNLSIQIERSNLAVMASATSQAQDLASGVASTSSERDLLASLRQIRATGRIVLSFTPESRGIDTIPDLPLEDGDFFLIPSVPASINVVGAVYDQNSFLWVKGTKVGTILQYAGGADRDGDFKHEFIIRANGDVVSEKRRKGTIWGGGTDFYSLAINPGDTIVVPEKTFRPTALRNFIDYSQLFSQFAIGAAALSVLR